MGNYHSGQCIYSSSTVRAGAERAVTHEWWCSPCDGCDTSCSQLPFHPLTCHFQAPEQTWLSCSCSSCWIWQFEAQYMKVTPNNFWLTLKYWPANCSSSAAVLQLMQSCTRTKNLWGKRDRISISGSKESRGWMREKLLCILCGETQEHFQALWVE